MASQVSQNLLVRATMKEPVKATPYQPIIDALKSKLKVKGHIRSQREKIQKALSGMPH